MNDEEKKRFNREFKVAAKKAEKEKREMEELTRIANWKASYADRVRTYKELLKKANVNYTLEVDDDLNVSVRVNNEYYIVDTNHYFLNYNEPLSIETEEWEFDSLISRVEDLIAAQAAHETFLRQVKEFKKSLTADQIKMIKYFNQVY